MQGVPNAGPFGAARTGVGARRAGGLGPLVFLGVVTSATLVALGAQIADPIIGLAITRVSVSDFH